jgi:hypothetical protein
MTKERSNRGTNRILPYNGFMMNDKDNKSLQRIKILSEILDSKFEGPFGIRFGLDGILSFVPVIGDIITTLLSFSILVVAYRLGASSATLFRMAMNILFENLIDMIPVLGSFFDLWFQSNNRNLKILEAQLSHPERVSVISRIVLLSLILFVFFTMLMFVSLSWMMLQVFIGFIF